MVALAEKIGRLGNRQAGGNIEWEGTCVKVVG